MAEALYLRAIELDENARGTDPEGLATTLNNLALVYRKQGRLEEAERLHTRSLNLLQDTLGPNDARVAMSLHNLAAVYREQGRIEEARPLQERAVAVADKSLGRRDPDAIKMRTALAALGSAPPAGSSTPMPKGQVPRVAGKSALPPPPLVADPLRPGRGGGSPAYRAGPRPASPADALLAVTSTWRSNCSA